MLDRPVVFIEVKEHEVSAHNAELRVVVVLRGYLLDEYLHEVDDLIKNCTTAYIVEDSMPR